jgi:hypothetical protein
MWNWLNVTVLKGKSSVRVNRSQNTGISCFPIQCCTYGDFIFIGHNAANLGMGPRFTVREMPKGSSVMGLTGRRCIPLAVPLRSRAAIFKDARRHGWFGLRDSPGSFPNYGSLEILQSICSTQKLYNPRRRISSLAPAGSEPACGSFSL